MHVKTNFLFPTLTWKTNVSRKYVSSGFNTRGRCCHGDHNQYQGFQQ